MDFIRKFPVENILLDACLLVIAFLVPNTNLLLSHNLVAAFWIAAPLQVLALFCAFFGRDSYSGGRDLPAWLSSITILNMILAVGGFIWLYLAAFAVEHQTGGFPYWGFRFAFLMALFGGISAVAFGSKLADEHEVHIAVRYLLVLVVFIYLCFTESLLEVSIGIANPGSLTIILATFISYLPVRLALAFQPPFSYWDLVSAIVCFGLYLSSLLSAK